MADLRITYGCLRCHGAPMFEDIDGHYQAAHPGKTYRQDRDVLAAPASQALARLDAVGAERDRLAGALSDTRSDLGRLAAVADAILRHFTEAGHLGQPCHRTGWVPDSTLDRWRAAIRPGPVPPRPRYAPGGPVPAQPYWVGEDQPEAFTPRTDGEIKRPEDG